MSNVLPRKSENNSYHPILRGVFLAKNSVLHYLILFFLWNRISVMTEQTRKTPEEIKAEAIVDQQIKEGLLVITIEKGRLKGVWMRAWGEGDNRTTLDRYLLTDETGKSFNGIVLLDPMNRDLLEENLRKAVNQRAQEILQANSK